jgi:hypothetical protein
MNKPIQTVAMGVLKNDRVNLSDLLCFLWSIKDGLAVELIGIQSARKLKFSGFSR